MSKWPGLLVLVAIATGVYFYFFDAKPLRSRGHNGAFRGYHDQYVQLGFKGENSIRASLLAGGPHTSSLRLGDLPGYTGWARPSNTLAHFFSIVRMDPATPIEGSNWTVSVVCRHEEGKHGGAFFYVRAYGKSILPGFVTDHRNGTYDITILPFDAGIYQLEVVLTFSNPPRLDVMPSEEDEAGYEGYLLPGFPLELVVFSEADQTRVDRENRAASSARLCGMSELLEESPRSTAERGRWLVMENIAEKNYSRQSSNNALYQGYLSGLNSVGFRLDYVPRFCSLTSSAQALEDFHFLATRLDAGAVTAKSNATTASNSSSAHVIFIGDSNFRIQEETFRKQFGHVISSELISTSGGIIPMLPAVKERLQELKNDKNDRDYFVLFNTGLHDIDKLCVKHRSAERQQYITIPDVNFSCFAAYHRAVEDFVDVINDFPATLRVWETTTAGWPKWGLYGAAWPTTRLQPLPLSPNAVEHLNTIAWEVMKAKNVMVLDAYWLTLSRPDNRQINADNDLTQHLVHAGEEVYSVLIRKWAMLIIEALRTKRRRAT